MLCLVTSIEALHVWSGNRYLTNRQDAGLVLSTPGGGAMQSAGGAFDDSICDLLVGVQLSVSER